LNHHSWYLYQISLWSLNSAWKHLTTFPTFPTFTATATPTPTPPTTATPPTTPTTPLLLPLLLLLLLRSLHTKSELACLKFMIFCRVFRIYPVLSVFGGANTAALQLFSATLKTRFVLFASQEMGLTRWNKLLIWFISSGLIWFISYLCHFISLLVQLWLCLSWGFWVIPSPYK
jgi:hypothetical protein